MCANCNCTHLLAKGKQILCTYDSRIVVLYLCTREHVAIKAAAEQSLYGKGNLYKSIKWVLRPSFSSAIYGSGWATKIEQQRILALTLPRECFEELLNDSVVCQEDEKPEVRVDWYNGGITEIIYPHEEVLELRDKELEKRIKANLSGSEFED